MSQTTFAEPSDLDTRGHVLDTEDRSTELVDTHRRAGQLVAELSDGPAWATADTIVSRLIAEADAVAGPPRPIAGTSVPAVVRCRELALAQRRMVIAIEAGSSAGSPALVRARALLADLGELATRDRATLPR